MDEFEPRSRNNSNNSRRKKPSSSSSSKSSSRHSKPKFKQPTQAALEAFVADRMEAEGRNRLAATPHGVGYIAARQEIQPDPLALRRGPPQRQSTLRRGFERGVGTLRKSGRHVRKKALDTRRSLRRAAKRPVIPYNHLRRIQADETIQRANSCRITHVQSPVFDEDDFVPVTEDDGEDIPSHNYTLWLKDNSPKLRPCEDRVLRVLLPSNKERKKFFQTYGSLFSCRCPPRAWWPIGMVVMVMLQVAMYIWYWYRSENHNSHQTIVLDTLDSMWIYDPHKRHECYRFFTYAILHKDLEHILGNVGIQLVIGFLLELVYKWRILLIFFIGIISGSLASSIFEPTIKLIGSSGGSYALIGAYIIMFLRRRADFPRPLRWFNAVITLALLIFVTVDLYFAYQRRWHAGRQRVSHAAHIAGLITGWTIGYATLWSWKNRMRKSDIAPYVGLAISLVIYFFFVIGAIMFNVFASPAGSLLFPNKSS